jgi:hypothetical protein
MDQVIDSSTAYFTAYLIQQGYSTRKLHDLGLLARHVMVSPGDPGTMAARLMEAVMAEYADLSPGELEEVLLTKEPDGCGLDSADLAGLNDWIRGFLLPERVMLDLIIWDAQWQALVQEQTARYSEPYMAKGFSSVDALALFKIVSKLSENGCLTLGDVDGHEKRIEALALHLLDYVSEHHHDVKGLAGADKQLINNFLERQK